MPGIFAGYWMYQVLPWFDSLFQIVDRPLKSNAYISAKTYISTKKLQVCLESFIKGAN